MKLSTGKVRFTMEFDNGDIGEIYFNPNDKGIHDRIKAFGEAVEHRIKSLDIEKHKKKFEGFKGEIFDYEHPEKLFDASPEELLAIYDQAESLNEISQEYNEAVKAELDTVFGTKISDVAFRYCDPFDTVTLEDGTREMYILHFIHWLMIEMKKYGEENHKAMNRHAAKYAK